LPGGVLELYEGMLAVRPLAFKAVACIQPHAVPECAGKAHSLVHVKHEVRRSSQSSA
jgi:hypothetical protein